MARYSYHFRVKASMPYNAAMATNKPTDSQLMQFNELLWNGLDDEGYCVYRRNSITKEVVRIDFQYP
jgi:hypothetical protein